MEELIGFPMENEERADVRSNNGQAITLPMSLDELKKMAGVEKLKRQQLPNSGTKVAYVRVAINKRATIVPIWFGETIDTSKEMSVILYREGERFYGLVNNVGETDEV